MRLVSFSSLALASASLSVFCPFGSLLSRGSAAQLSLSFSLPDCSAMASPPTAAARGAAVPSTSAPAAAAPAPNRSRRQPLRNERRRGQSSIAAPKASKSVASAKSVTLLDYGAGNVRSVRNAIRALGYELKEVIEEEQRELDWLEIRPRSNSTSGKLNPSSLFLLLLLPLLLLSSPPLPRYRSSPPRTSPPRRGSSSPAWVPSSKPWEP
jgi:hypothetical protein